jgi:hypothetical protein
MSYAPVTWSAWQCVSSKSCETQLAHQSGVPRVLFEHAVEQHGLARCLIGEQVAIGARNLIEELAKKHGGR